MEITVKNRNIRMSATKVRPVLYGLRGMNAEQAKITLAFTNKKAAYFLHNLVKAGIAAAKENYLDADKVIIKAIFCGEGQRLKRIVPWSKGQARRIEKRLCHLTLVLESKEDTKEVKETVKKEDIKTDIKANKESK